MHTYYKLASNLLDYHRNYKAPTPEAETGPKRSRSSFSNMDGEESSSSHNPAKRKREDFKGRASGSHKDFRHWPPTGHPLY